MRGTVPHYLRHIVIGTGSLNWTEEVTDLKGSFAERILKQLEDTTKDAIDHVSNPPEGLVSKPTRSIITNATFPPTEIGSDSTRLMVFPDWLMADDVSLVEIDKLGFGTETLKNLSQDSMGQCCSNMLTQSARP